MTERCPKKNINVDWSVLGEKSSLGGNALFKSLIRLEEIGAKPPWSFILVQFLSSFEHTQGNDAIANKVLENILNSVAI